MRLGIRGDGSIESTRIVNADTGEVLEGVQAFRMEQVSRLMQVFHIKVMNWPRSQSLQSLKAEFPLETKDLPECGEPRSGFHDGLAGPFREVCESFPPSVRGVGRFQEIVTMWSDGIDDGAGYIEPIFASTFEQSHSNE